MSAQAPAPADHPVLDLWAPILPTPAVGRWVVENFPDEMLGYLRVFYRQEPSQDMVRERYAGFQFSEEDVLAAIDAAGIQRTLITGFDEKASCGKTFIPNDLVADLSARHPGRFLPFAGADVCAGMESVRSFERAVRERGFRGLSLRPFMIGLPADHRRYYPLYAKAAELGVPVSIHASANWTTCAVNDFGHPRHFDAVAADFPELTLILSHAGYPWVLESTLLAWKYPNVYLELAAHRPRYFATPGTGWEPLMRFGQTTIQDKVLFGTGWFLIGRNPAELVAEMRALPVAPGILRKWLYDNAARLFGLPPLG